MVGAVLVTGDDDPGDPVVRDGPAGVVGLREHRVHPFQHPLCDGGRTSDPRRRSHDQNLRVQQLLVDLRPVVARAEVGLHSRQDVQIGRADDLNLDATLTKFVQHHLGQRLGVGR